MEEIEEINSGVVVKTRNGRRVNAGTAVIATNSPVNDRTAIHTKQAPYRTDAMAFRLARNTLPDALYWDTLDDFSALVRFLLLTDRPGAAGRSRKHNQARRDNDRSCRHLKRAKLAAQRLDLSTQRLVLVEQPVALVPQLALALADKLNLKRRRTDRVAA
jgi:hypothetical protein